MNDELFSEEVKVSAQPVTLTVQRQTLYWVVGVFFGLFLLGIGILIGLSFPRYQNQARPGGFPGAMPGKGRYMPVQTRALPRGNGRGISGTISLLDSTAFALKQSNGNAISIIASSATKVTKGQTALHYSDLKIGDRVIVQGAPTPDGEVQAASIQVTPQEI